MPYALPRMHRDDPGSTGAHRPVSQRARFCHDSPAPNGEGGRIVAVASDLLDQIPSCFHGGSAPPPHGLRPRVPSPPNDLRANLCPRTALAHLEHAAQSHTGAWGHPVRPLSRPGRGQRGATGARPLLLTLLLGVGSACERQAPGPEACGNLALRWAGPPEPEEYAGGRVRSARAAGVEEIARLCVTTPFDRAVIQCAEEGGTPERCLHGFRDRRRRALGDGT
jgi:hypothetical protein